MGHEPSITPEPGESPLDNPPPPHNFEALLLVRALDDLEPNALAGDIGGNLVSLIAAIGEDMLDEGEQTPRLLDQSGGAVAVLDVGGDHLDAEEQSDGIDERVALDPLDFLTRVIPNRILAAPPFSVALTACVSMTAAVGEASRPSTSRNARSRR